TPRAVVLFAVGLPIAVVPAVLGGWTWPGWAVFFAGSVLLLLVDTALLLPPARVATALEAPKSVYVGRSAPCTLTVSTTGRRAQRFDVLCDVAAALEPFPAVSIDVPAEGSTRHEFLVRPRRRGRFRIERLWLRWRGPLGLMAITRVRNVDAD